SSSSPSRPHPPLPSFPTRRSSDLTPNLATSVVLYREIDGKEVSIGAYGGRGEVTGGSFPVQVWTDYMQQALEGEKVEQFPARGELPDKPKPENTNEPAAPETRAPSGSDGGSGSGNGGNGDDSENEAPDEEPTKKPDDDEKDKNKDADSENEGREDNGSSSDADENGSGDNEDSGDGDDGSGSDNENDGN